MRHLSARRTLSGAHLSQGAAMSVNAVGASDVQSIVWPPLLVGDSAQLAALVAGLEGTQWLGHAEIEAAQGEQLGRLALHLSRQSPAFAARLRSAGMTAADLGRVDRLAGLPVLRRRHLQEAGADFFARHVPRGHPADRRDQDLGLDRRAGDGQAHPGLPPVLGRLHGARASLARPRLRRPDDLDSANQPVVRRDGGLGLPGRDALRHRSGAGDGQYPGIDEQVELIDRFLPQSVLAFPTNLRAFADIWKARGQVPRGCATCAPSARRSRRSCARTSSTASPSRTTTRRRRPAYRAAVPGERPLPRDGRVARGRGARRGRRLRRGRGRPRRRSPTCTTSPRR